MAITKGLRCRHLPRRRAAAAGIRLCAADVALARGMRARGDAQHFVASWFGVNPGRIAEIATGERFPDVCAAPQSELPPPGPYLTLREAAQIGSALLSAREALDRAIGLVGRPPFTS